MHEDTKRHLTAYRASVASEIAGLHAEVAKKTKILQKTDALLAEIDSDGQPVRPRGRRKADPASEKRSQISETVMDMFRLAKEPLARTDIVNHIASTLQITVSDDIKRLTSAVYQVLNRYDVECNPESGVLRKVGNGRNIKWERVPHMPD